MRIVKEKSKRYRVTVPEDVRVPGTNVMLEAGDVIEIIEGKKKAEDDDEDSADEPDDDEDDDMEEDKGKGKGKK